MQSFVVSARKYRPVTWDDVVGQDHVVTTLRNAIKTNHLAQSFLFCGPRGVGKTTCARILAKTINCENLQEDGEACDVCESCKTFRENASFNIHEIDAASNNSVEDIRSLTDQVRYAPQAGKYKIYIIDEVHMLSAAAFNAFLKTLEEPPVYVKFILATTEKHRIIPTILSRCQIFDFNRIKVKDMMLQLKKICKKEKVQIDDDALHLIAQKADGAMRDALSIYDRIASIGNTKITAKDVIENLNILDYDYYFKITDACVAEDAAQCLLLYAEISNKGFDGDTFIIGLAEHMRNLLVCKDEHTLQLLEASDVVIEKYKEQSKIITASFLLSALNILNQADVQYRISKNKRLHVELALMKLCYIHNAIQTNGSIQKKTFIEAPIQKLQPIEKRNAENVAYIRTTTKTDIAKEPVVQPETISIPKKGNLRNKILQNENAAEISDIKEKINPEDIISITPELFFMAWKQFADGIRKDHQRIAVVMDHAAVSIDEKNTIDVKLDSQTEVTMLREISQQLLKFLQEAAENKNIQITFSVNAIKNGAHKPYTILEKYKKMEELNPLIRELKDTLGFELDY
ncbi:MAG: DNA polymerase III subunit gamma/tau [Fimbriimonadaceae bacterium]|nr:DNA polymerase III subunit gamma/tau [Chitinophagales bacterium]